MHNHNLEFITKYINEDNVSNTKIYNFLYKEYERSLTIFENNINIFGIYFFDILKILTHINLKKREIDNNLLIKELDESKLKNFPYYTVKNINHGIRVKDKIYGKDITCSNKKKFLKKLLNFKNYLFNKKNIIATCEFRIDNDKLIYLSSNKKNTFYIFDYYSGKNKFKIPLLKNQLSDLKKVLQKLEEKFFNHSNLNIPNIIENHINANCIEGKEKLHSKSNYLIIGAGTELKNRLISSIFKQNNKKIIQIAHGDSYGTFDEPVWSALGDQYNADYIIGYGDGYINNKNLNYFRTNNQSKYLGGSSSMILNITKNRFHYQNIDNCKFIYFPTTFSGISKRYGPHRDMPDQLYINWQLKIFKLFKKKLIFKIHPKESYINFYPSYIKFMKGDILKYFIKSNILIFDHISTAFNLACSSNNLIIYFDLGTRKLNNQALELIKKRVLYYKIDKELPNYNDIINNLNKKFIDKKQFNDEFIKNYCITNNKKRINLIKHI